MSKKWMERLLIVIYILYALLVFKLLFTGYPSPPSVALMGICVFIITIKILRKLYRM